MSSWSDGYITEIPYNSHFYRELTPRWLVTAATLLGRHAPDIERPYAYCELGCGQGFGTALTAAVNPKGRFFAIDFNPAQIANAARFAQAAGLTNIDFCEMSFRQFLQSPADAFPQFDFIVMHGIYSWVSRENQETLVGIVDRFLKPGGIVYNGYNCHPGWAPFAPAQKLIRLHAEQNPARADRQAQAGLQFLRQLQEGGAKAFSANPALGRILEKALGQDAAYLAHEYLSSQWSIHHFADVANDMANAKLSYIGSARLQDNLDAVSLPAGLIPLLNGIADPILRETAKDLCRNQNFRRDIYVKGAMPMTETEYADALQSLSLLPLRPPPTGDIVFRTAMGEAAAKDAVYRPLLRKMMEGPLTFASAASQAAFAGLPRAEVVQALTLLIAGGYAHARHDETQAASWTPAHAFNRAAISRAMAGHDLAYLAAPAAGSGIAADFVEMATAGALMEQPRLRGDALVAAVWKRFEAGRRLLLKDGKPLETREENLAELADRLGCFEINVLPVWQRLGVLPCAD